jgi:hypothetical protein
LGRIRTYAVNELFFDEILTEVQAYWLGFLTADGYVTDRHVRVRLQELDKSHLRKFAEALESNHPIFEGVHQGYYYADFIVGSKYMVGALANLGLTRNKSLTIQQSTQVSLDLLPHYWRGVFDGDGSLISQVYSGRKSERWALSLVGNEYIIASFTNFVSQELGEKGIHRIVGNTHSVTYSGITSPQNISQLLYKDANIYLERKYEQYLILSQRKLHRPNHDHITEADVLELYKMYRNWNKVAAELKMHRVTLARKRRDWGL